MLKKTTCVDGKCTMTGYTFFYPLQCIVVGLQSTGESRTREVLDENDGHLDRFVSAAE